MSSPDRFSTASLTSSASGVRTKSLPRLIAPRPGIGRMLVFDREAVVARLDDGPGQLPSVAVNGPCGAGRDRLAECPALEAEAPVTDAVRIGHQREAREVEILGARNGRNGAWAQPLDARCALRPIPHDDAAERRRDGDARGAAAQRNDVDVIAPPLPAGRDRAVRDRHRPARRAARGRSSDRGRHGRPAPAARAGGAWS